MDRGAFLFPLLLLVACSEAPTAPAEGPGELDLSTSLAVVDGHMDGTPASSELLVCGFVVDLDDLLAEFDQQVGPFEDDRLNRSLARARLYVLRARAAALEPDLPRTFRDLRGAMRELEKGAALPVSGKGFADDIASLGSYMAEVFTRELIELAGQLGSVSANALEAAAADYEDGLTARSGGEWEAAVAAFGTAVWRLDREIEIGAPCG